MKFYLGTHKPQWLRFPQFTGVPLFLSQSELRSRKSLPTSLAPFAVDSGGFTQLQKHGRWTVEPARYVDDLRRYNAQTGGAMEWAAPQDWMCERVVIEGGTFKGQRFAGTGLSVEEHQQRTVANYCELRELAPELDIIPVLQGLELDDYLRCLELYAAAGVDLRALPRVGVGSVCRREATAEIGALMRELAGEGLALHGFGVKQEGLRRYAGFLTSADSMAWSFNARWEAQQRRRRGLPPGRLGCSHGVDGRGSCANCPTYALAWRSRVVVAPALVAWDQPSLFDAALTA